MKVFARRLVVIIIKVTKFASRKRVHYSEKGRYRLKFIKKTGRKGKMNHRARLLCLTRKLSIIFTLAILTMVCLTASARAEAGTVKAGVANVRTGPGTNYEISGSVYADTKVEILESSGGWHKIKFGSLTGWMCDTVLEVKQSEALMVTGNTVNLRSGPGTNYDIVGQAIKNDILDHLATEGDWFKIRTNDGSIGYISSSLAQKTGTKAAQDIVTSPPAASPEETVKTTQYVQAISGTVNIRSGPGTTFAEKARTDENQSYAVTGREGDWVQIALADGSSGYVASWLVRETAAGQLPSVPTATIPGNTVTMESGTPQVYLDGQKLNFDVPPIIDNDRTLVPLRAIFEAMGADVEWVDTTRTVKAKRGNTEVILQIGSLYPTVNGQVWALDVPAKIINDRTLAPLRFVGEAFGGQVGWDDSTRTVTITSAPLNARAVALTVNSGEVNLRSGPGVIHESLEMVGVGERLAILGEKDGWYQVSRSGLTGWIAGWVVDVAWEENEPAEEEPVLEPEKPVIKPEPVKPEKPGDDVVWLSSVIDKKGLHIIMESGSELDSDSIEKSARIKYTFADKQIEGLYLLKKEFGGGYVNAEAKNQGEDLTIEITFPSGAEYKTSLSDDGKKASVTIFNYITSVERKTFAQTGERIIIHTALPSFDYTSLLEDDTIYITLNDVMPGKVEKQYRYSSDLVSRIRFASTDRGQSTQVTIDTDNLGKYVFAESGEKQAFTVLMVEKGDIKPREKNLVVLDPGHGGNDTGARGKEVDEKDVNLAIALKAGAILMKNGIHVEYTRKTDVTVGLEERALIANDFNAELFVSIHNNSDTARKGHGTETYYYAPLSMPELYMQIDERKLLAQKLQEQLISKLKLTDRGAKEGNLSVLRNTTMPSALVEVMFISWPEEHELLKQEKTRDLAAEAIAQGILNYLKAR